MVLNLILVVLVVIALLQYLILEQMRVQRRNYSPNPQLIEEPDTLLPRAVEIIKKYDTASASFLQRKLFIGYARASRLLDKLEEAGYVGPANGSEPRKILIKTTQHSS